MKFLVGIIGAIIGAVIGFLIPGVGPVLGAKIGFAAGTLVGGILFPPSGPKGQDLKPGDQAYGEGLTIAYGTVRLPGRLIWATQIFASSTAFGHQPDGEHYVGCAMVFANCTSLDGKNVQAQRLLRLWCDTKLRYDVTNPSAVSNSDTSSKMTIYYGSETQAPDPYMEMPEHLGAGNVPAYRGLVYIVFKGIKLADFGNRIPNMTAEFTFNQPNDNFAFAGPLDFGELVPDHLLADPYRPYIYGMGSDGTNSHLQRVDAINNLKQQETTLSVGIIQGEEIIDADGFLYFSAGSAHYNRAYKFDALTQVQVAVGMSSSSTAGTGVQQSADCCVFDRGGIKYVAFLGAYGEVCVINRTSMTLAGYAKCNYYSDVGGTARGWMICVDSAGILWALNTQNTGLNTFVTKIDVAELETSVDTTYGIQLFKATHFDLTTQIQTAQFMCYDPDDNALILGTNHDTTTGLSIPVGAGLIRFDIAGLVTVDWADFNLLTYAKSAFRDGPINGVLWLPGPGADQISSVYVATLEYPVTYSLSNWGIAGLTGNIYDAPTASLWVMTSSGYYRLYLNRATAVDPTLDSIVNDLCSRTGLPATDYDSTELSVKTVAGYAIAKPATVRQAIEPLASTFFFEGIESDYAIHFRLRGRASSGDIPEKDLGYVANDDTINKWQEDRTQELDLPERLELTYLDSALHQQQGVQSAKRTYAPVSTMSSRTKTSYNVPIVMSPDEAKQTVEKWLYLTWLQRNQFNATMLWKYILLDPSDVVRVTVGGAVFKVRLIRTDFSGVMAITIQAVSESEQTYISGATGTIAGTVVPPESTSIPLVLGTNLMLMDSPFFLDTDGVDGITGFYYALGSFYEPWPGANLFKSTDDASYTSIATSLTTEATWGKTTTALASPRSPHTWDRVNTLTIAIPGNQTTPDGGGGEFISPTPTGNVALASTDETSVLNGANMIWMSNGEIIQFANAVQNADGTYTLSTLLRGRRGTENNVSTHTAGETVVLLSNLQYYRATTNLGEFGALRYYRAATVGQNVADAATQQLTLASNDLKPYSPACVHATRDGSNNMTITWQRRTRYGGRWVDGTGTVPLHESSESYDVLFLNGSTVVRTQAGLTSPTTTYTAAQQTADGLTPGNLVRVEVYQNSASVGRGFVADQTI